MLDAFSGHLPAPTDPELDLSTFRCLPLLTAGLQQTVSTTPPEQEVIRLIAGRSPSLTSGVMSARGIRELNGGSVVVGRHRHHPDRCRDVSARQGGRHTIAPVGENRGDPRVAVTQAPTVSVLTSVADAVLLKIDGAQAPAASATATCIAAGQPTRGGGAIGVGGLCSVTNSSGVGSWSNRHAGAGPA